MSRLIEHLEKHLGLIDGGWSASPEGDPIPFQVVKFVPDNPGIVSYSTLGLSRIPLQSPVSAKSIRQELCILAPASFGEQNIPAVLQSVANEAIERGSAYLRGELIGPRGNLFEGTAFTALYVTLPIYFPDTFQEMQDEEGHSIVFAWLIPITDTEARFVATHGWSEFEDLMDQHQPDLVDFARPVLV